LRTLIRENFGTSVNVLKIEVLVVHIQNVGIGSKSRAGYSLLVDFLPREIWECFGMDERYSYKRLPYFSSTKLLKMPPMDGSAWYGINSPDGVFRRYILIKPKNNKKRREINKIDSTEDRIKDLDDYYNLFERMENQKRERLFNFFGDVNMEDDEILEVKNSSRTLWTEKYAPNNFLDLLSDDVRNFFIFNEVSAKSCPQIVFFICGQSL